MRGIKIDDRLRWTLEHAACDRAPDLSNFHVDAFNDGVDEIPLSGKLYQTRTTPGHTKCLSVADNLVLFASPAANAECTIDTSTIDALMVIEHGDRHHTECSLNRKHVTYTTVND